MDKKSKNKIKIKEKKNLNININNSNNNLFPHKTKLNNLKSKKYFSNTTNNTEIMKKALLKYRENNKPINTQTEITNSSSSTTCNISKINKSNDKYDKIILNYPEPKTKTSFQKIAPKILELSIKENEDIDEFKIYEDKRLINEKLNHKKFISEIKEPSNINIDSIIDDEDSIDFDINTEEDNNEPNIVKNNLTDRNNNILNIGINLNDINFIECIKIESLYSELIKHLEINKMNKFEIKLNIVKNFLKILNDEKNHNLFLTFDINSLNNNSINIINKNNNKNPNIFLLIKEYLIQQLIFLYIIILIGLIKSEEEKNTYLSGIQNLSFYFHQNFQVFNFILTSKINKNNIKLLGKEQVQSYEKCLNMVKENKTWLNENNFVKCLQINNKMSKQIIKNLFEQIRIYFNTNPYFDNKDIYKNKTINKTNDNNNIKNNTNNTNNNKNKVNSYNKNNINSNKNLSKNNKNKNYNNIQKDFIDSDINLLLEYIKSYKNVKFTNILKDLKYSPSINYLKDKVKISDKNKNIINSIKKNKSKNILENQIEKKPEAPFLKPINQKYKYTLVLDLDETLIHYIPFENEEYVEIRPGAEEFIKELSKFYEIIIFTASQQSYADLVLKGIDNENKISAKLYRQHTMRIGNSNIKDLDKLGRDLKKIIIVDNSPDNYNLQPKNGINVIDFDGNENDDILFWLKNDLINLVKFDPDDVRPFLKEIQINMNKRANEIINKNRNQNKNINFNNNNKEIIGGKNKNKKNNVINDKIMESIKESEFENTITKNKNEI